MGIEEAASSDARPQFLHSSRARTTRRSERGQSLVEFALVLPVFIVLVMGIVDFGMALRSYVTVTNAAREGARVGIVCDSGTAESTTDDAVKQRVHDYSGDLIDTSDVTVTWPSGYCESAGSVQVKATYDYEFITPLGSFVNSIAGPLTLSSTTKMRVE